MHTDITTTHVKPRPLNCCSFALQHGQQLYRHIYLGCKEEDNVQKNFELLFTALALITIELANEEVAIDLIRLSIALQVLSPFHLFILQIHESKGIYQEQLIRDFLFAMLISILIG